MRIISQIIKLRLIIYKILVLVLLSSCNSKIDNQEESNSSVALIDSLLSQANDYSKTKEERFKLTQKAHMLIEY